MSDVNAYDELLQLERERDEALAQVEKLEALLAGCNSANTGFADQRDEALAARDKAWEALRLTLADAERLEAERDRYRKALKDIQYMSHYKAAQFYPSAVNQVLALHLIARQALAATEDE